MLFIFLSCTHSSQMRSWLRSISTQFLYNFFKTELICLVHKEMRGKRQVENRRRKGRSCSTKYPGKYHLFNVLASSKKPGTKFWQKKKPAPGFHSLTTVQPRSIESHHFYEVSITALCKMLPSPGRKCHSLVTCSNCYPDLPVPAQTKPIMLIWDFLPKPCDPAAVLVP